MRASIDHEISALLTQAQPTVPQPQAAPAKASSIRRTPTRGVDRTNGSADGTRRQSALAFLRDHRLLLWRGIGAFLGSVVALGISSINAHPDYAKLLPLLIIPAAILALGLVVLTQLPKPGQPLQAAWPRLLIASIIFSITLFLGLNLLAISVNYPQLVSGYTLLWGVIIGIGGALVCWRTTQLFRRILFLSLITMVGDVFANYASGNTPDLFGLFVGPPLLYALTFSPELVQYIAQRVRRSSG